MIELNRKLLCECCFSEVMSDTCPYCGYNKNSYISDPIVLPCGSILAGKYIIGKVIGKGGFGITYLAYDCKADRKVAIKEYYPNGLATRSLGKTALVVSNETDALSFQTGAEKFYNEAKLVSKFNGNPGIVSVYEFFYENDTVYFAMEYLSGKSLKDYLNDKGAISEAQAIFIADCVSSALLAAHSANVMHRDISPDNIMICDDGTVKLIDFGAARQVTAESSQNLSVILKPGFAPLEQYQKKGKQGPWTDIYALGASLFYALTLDTIDDPMSRMEDDSEFQRNAYNISEKLWELIRKSTMLKIEDRFQDIFVFRNALSDIGIVPETLVSSNKEEEVVPEFRTAQPFNHTAVQTATQPFLDQTQFVQQIQITPSTPKGKKIGIIAGISTAAVALLIAGVFLLNLVLFSANTLKGKDNNPDALIKAANGYLSSDEYKYMSDNCVYDYEAFKYIGKISDYYQFMVVGKYLEKSTGKEYTYTEDDNIAVVLTETEEGIVNVPYAEWKKVFPISDSDFKSNTVETLLRSIEYDYATGELVVGVRIYNTYNYSITINSLELEVWTDDDGTIGKGIINLNEQLNSHKYVDKNIWLSGADTYKFIKDISKAKCNRNLNITTY